MTIMSYLGHEKVSNEFLKASDKLESIVNSVRDFNKNYKNKLTEQQKEYKEKLKISEKEVRVYRNRLDFVKNNWNLLMMQIVRRKKKYWKNMNKFT